MSAHEADVGSLTGSGKRRGLLWLAIILTGGLAPGARAAGDPPSAVPVTASASTRSPAPSRYLREHIYDTAVHADEALVNVRIANHRWPDCTTLESALDDIGRLEGARTDSERALALWKWFRILVSATGGDYAYEGPPGREVLCQDPHKILTVYGHHQCDGLSWAMCGLWRAGGFIAFDECTFGHTIAALRYRDADGQSRFHNFDPQRRYYPWDSANERVGTCSLPVMHGMVFRHLTAPQQLHSLRTSLRPGESRIRLWTSAGAVVPSGKDKLAAARNAYYQYAPGKRSGVYASVGEEVQRLEALTDPATFERGLYPGSTNVACSPGPESAALHPRAPNQRTELIYRLAPPYVIAEATCEATLRKAAPDDTCRLWLSRDGQRWEPVFDLQNPGRETVTLDLGQSAWAAGRPHLYTAYDAFLKAEFLTHGDVRSVGLDALTLTARRMLNKRTLPNVRPGENVFQVTADRLAPGWALELEVAYRVRGERQSVTRSIREFPHYFRITTPPCAEEVRTNYDLHFNEGELQMERIELRLRPAEAGPITPSLPEAEARAAFTQASPHPADLSAPKRMERPERDVRETSGFFPQADATRGDPERLPALLEQVRGNDPGRRWLAAAALGQYPQALDALLEVFPSADGDLTVYLCKALAQLRDPKALPHLLEKWRRAPNGAPGTRYLPDVFAAIGDRSVVPALVAALPRCRFDFRFHIAHALGVLGGPEAEAALRDLAADDPFPAVREEARRGLTPRELIPPAGQLKPDHPRLLLRPQATPWAISLEQLRAPDTNAAASRLLAQLRAQKSAAAQALVWQLTGDSAAAERALATLRAYRYPGEVDTFHVYFTLTQSALAYDWLHGYGGFTPEIKADIRTRLRPLALRALDFADDHMFHNYIWMSAGGAALWALATAGDDAEANQLFERVRHRFNTGLFPAWKYLDGLPSEPMGYWALYVFTPGALTILATQSAFETDAIGAIRADGDWLARHFENVIHSTLPDLRYVPWGDLQSGPNGGVTYEMAGIMDALTWALRSPQGAHFSRWLASRRGLARFHGDTPWYYFLYTRRLETAPAAPPLSFVAGGPPSAHLLARSGWDDGATIVAFRATDHFGDHHHYDQGSFIVYRNGLLAVDPPVYRTVRGPQQPTDVHNTLLLDGEPQRPVRGQWFKTIADFERNLTAGRRLETGDLLFSTDAGPWTAAAAQLAQAYSPERVRSWVRQVLFVRPAHLVVVDQLTPATEGSLHEVSWLLQLPRPPAVTNGAAWASNGKSWIRCRALLPGNAVPEIAATGVNTHRLSLRYPVPSALRLVHVLDVGDGPAPAAAAEASASILASGIEVRLAGRTYRFAHEPPHGVESGEARAGPRP